MSGAGYENLMPEGRSWPWKFFPKRGVALSVTFGEPIPADKIRDALWATTAGSPGGVSSTASKHELTIGDPVEEERSLIKAGRRWLGDILQHRIHQPGEESKQTRVARLRSEITALLQREVTALGRSVLGRKS